MSFFDLLPPLPEDPIFGLNATFKKDPRPYKKSFVTGFFIQENGKVPLLKSVAAAEKAQAAKEASKEYNPIEGDPILVEEIGKLALGSFWHKDHFCGIQTLGGTGALFLAGALVRKWTEDICVFDPTWVNHKGIFSYAGLKVHSEIYYKERHIQTKQMIRFLETKKAKSAVLFHASCHNPTAMDLSIEEWEAFAHVCKDRQLFPIFDMAYQGFAEGVEEETALFAPFIRTHLPFALAYSTSKNFSLYGERVGALFIFNPDKTSIPSIESHLKQMARATYSNPPLHGGRLVKMILTSVDLKALWFEELFFMRQRINEMRMQFVALLGKKDPKGRWEFLNQGRGLFCYSGLSPNGVKYLRDQKGFYIAQDGRINLTGLSKESLEPFIDAFLEAKG